MPGRHRASAAQPVAAIVGGAAGAVLRYALWTLWPQPHVVFVSTVLVTALAFLMGAFLLTAGPLTTPRAAVLGLCASAASLSAWAVLTVSQTPLLSAAFLIVTPGAALAGLVGGLLLARVVVR